MDGVIDPVEGAPLGRRFGGVARVYGREALARFGAARVAVVGIGGVGSWAAEALARSGCARLTLIDLDHVAESNTNRQIHALEESFGRAKVEVMAERVRAIHPAAQTVCNEEFIDAENVGRLCDGHEVVLDCTDQVGAKAALVAWSRAGGVPVVVSGAAGGRSDPLRLKRGDLGEAIGDPLLASLRHRLRRRHGFEPSPGGRPARLGVLAVWSDEPVSRPVVAEPVGASVDFVPGLSCAGYGSVVTVTASMGLALAACVLDLLATGTAGPRSVGERAPRA